RGITFSLLKCSLLFGRLGVGYYTPLFLSWVIFGFRLFLNGLELRLFKNWSPHFNKFFIL
ncbi:hypothetical protein MMJ63_21575, partial [Bacillus vallismortis]|nr:hypothetical protein [Bacillus vallismortis]